MNLKVWMSVALEPTLLHKSQNGESPNSQNHYF